MKRIDAHAHVAFIEPPFRAMMECFDLRLLNICVAGPSEENLKFRRRQFAGLAGEYPGRAAWATAFPLPDFTDPGFMERALAFLADEFKSGAAACKFWKNIGMEIRKPSGDFLLIDDPFLDPVFNFLERKGRTAIIHNAEPLICWRPLEKGAPHSSYFTKNPQYHMYGKSDFPSHETLIAALDRRVARHPKLRFVAAHLYSLEQDVKALSSRFDRFPNLAADTASRLIDLAYYHAPDFLVSWFNRYPDRILFGTDVGFNKVEGLDYGYIEDNYRTEFAFFETGGEVQIQGKPFTGLRLPLPILNRFYYTNALNWIPGLGNTFSKE